MDKFSVWLEMNPMHQTANDVKAGFNAVAGAFSFMKYSRAAMLHIAGREPEALDVLKYVPPQNRDAVMQLLKRDWPNPNPKLTTSKIDADPQFKNWLEKVLIPFVDQLEGKTQQQPQVPAQQSQQQQSQPNPTIDAVYRVADSLGIRRDFLDVNMSRDGRNVLIRNRRSGRVVSDNTMRDANIRAGIKSLFGLA